MIVVLQLFHIILGTVIIKMHRYSMLLFILFLQVLLFELEWYNTKWHLFDPKQSSHNFIIYPSLLCTSVCCLFFCGLFKVCYIINNYNVDDNDYFLKSLLLSSLLLLLVLLCLSLVPILRTTCGDVCQISDGMSFRYTVGSCHQQQAETIL